jgi:hypothetical protein
MKTITKLVITLLFVSFQHYSFAQKNAETEIRNLEELEGQSWVKKDTTTLFQLFSTELAVNTPLNRTATLKGIKRMTRLGKIDISYSKKIIEKITFINDLAVVMGQDIVKPEGGMKDAGKTVTRRYTDVWIKTKDKWMLIIRQATIISINS